MKMHNPPHPGEVLRELCLKPLGLTVTRAAAALGVSRKTLSNILNGRAGISPEMAVRLSLAFSTTAETWMNQQVQYDLWHVERRRKKFRVAKACLGYVHRIGPLLILGNEPYKFGDQNRSLSPHEDGPSAHPADRAE